MRCDENGTPRVVGASDLSVVVQGPVYKYITSNVIESIRHHLPNSEIILSTWQGEDVGHLKPDITILNQDPGACKYFIKPAQNVNRQIVSTMGGLASATKKFAIKTRTDALFEGIGFLDYFDRYPLRGEGPKIFNHKIVASALGTCDPRLNRHFFHLGDFFFFGETQDLLTLFDIPLVQERDRPESSPIVSEQYIVLAALAKFGFKIPLTGHYRSDWRFWRLWEAFLVANFVVAHPSNLGLLLPRKMYPLCPYHYERGTYQKIYHIFCAARHPWLSRLRHFWPDVVAKFIVPPR